MPGSSKGIESLKRNPIVIGNPLQAEIDACHAQNNPMSLPPAPFLPLPPKVASLPKQPVLDFRMNAGGGKCTIFGGSFRDDPVRKEKKAVRMSGASQLTAAALGQSASDGRLATGKSRGAASTRCSSAASTGSMWRNLAPFSRRDHVANLLCQPLPTKGEDFIDNYDKECSVGSLPVAPGHLAAVQTNMHSNHCYNPEFEKGCRAQKASEQWRGFPKDFYTEYTEMAVKQKNLMRA